MTDVAERGRSDSAKSVVGKLRCDRPRLAIIGCGAIAELYHLPALSPLRSSLGGLMLIDQNEERMRTIGAKFDIQEFATDYRAALPGLDGVVIATPPHLHYDIGLDCLKSGVHVLCEKPLAESLSEAREMVDEADRQGVALAVNHTRRLFPMNIEIKRLLTAGALGKLKRIQYIDGEPFTWSSQSGFHFRPGENRGVLFDRGIHSLDLICWWLGAKPTLISSRNDSYGGPEGVAIVRMQHQGCEIELKLNWLSELENTYCIVGQDYDLKGGIEQFGSATTGSSTDDAKAKSKSKTIRWNTKQRTYTDFGMLMIENFLAVVRGTSAPLVAGQDVLASLELMEECYATAQRLDLPWLTALESFIVE